MVVEAKPRRGSNPRTPHRPPSSLRTVAARLVVLLAAILLALTPERTSGAQPAKSIRRVLIFNDFAPIASPGVENIDRAIAEGMRQSPFQIELYSENLEATLFPDEATQKKLQDWYIQKYSNRKPEVIVTVGPASLRFMTAQHDRAFPNIPVVYCGVTEEMVERLKPGYYFIGVRSVAQSEKTLLAALRLQPNTTQVVVTGGTGAFDRVIEESARESLHPYEARLHFTYWTELDMPSLLKHLGQLRSRDTIVLHTSLMRDAAGNHFINASQSVPMIAHAASAAVFVLDESGVGRGAVGGDVLSWSVEGETAAAMAQRLLNGDKTKDIPSVRGKSAYVFDWRMLKRWGFQERDLPPGAEVRFRQLSLWERARRIWISGLAVIFGLVALAAYLQFSRKQLQKMRHAELELSGMLINAQEKERSRLASELHDDFSQRVALLALDLENTAELIDNAPGKARERLNVLMNSASELGADLHTLSHHLHSSTLEKLGLAAGLSSLCREFATQQGIQVDFTHDGLPRSIHPEAALALFRIAQEGLRNLKKHSGATRASVHLGKSGDQLHVLVTDEGVGFDVKKLKDRLGLGIRSMEERTALLGGRFEIDSQPGKGTKIKAWVPAKPRLRVLS